MIIFSGNTFSNQTTASTFEAARTVATIEINKNALHPNFSKNKPKVFKISTLTIWNQISKIHNQSVVKNTEKMDLCLGSAAFFAFS
jgi:flagellar basal body rod protein FlgG